MADQTTRHHPFRAGKALVQHLPRPLALAATLLMFTLPISAHGQDDSMPTEPEPMANSKSAAAIGKSHYLINCQQCHDADGRALANIDFIAADLTAPDTWYYGTTSLHIFRSIKFGAGLEMPPFKDSLSDETIWKIVAHVLNIGPRESRPSENKSKGSEYFGFSA